MTASQTPSTAEELRGAGLRVTAARVALLDTVRAGDHLGVEALATGVRDRVGHISLQAVYEALHALAAAGLVRRIEPAGSPARFELAVWISLPFPLTSPSGCTPPRGCSFSARSRR
ncbi:transcriptional repressor, partial [Actinomadura luteofluorescens]